MPAWTPTRAGRMPSALHAGQRRLAAVTGTLGPRLISCVRPDAAEAPEDPSAVALDPMTLVDMSDEELAQFPTMSASRSKEVRRNLDDLALQGAG